MLARASFFIAGVLFAASAYAGAWVLPKGQGLFIGQATYYASDRYYNADGKSTSQPRFAKFELQPYIEYGLSERTTVGGSFYVNRVEQSGERNQGIADAEIFLRGKLWSDDRQVLSIQPLLKLPSYYTSEAPPRGGSNSMDVELSLLYGRNQPLFKPEDSIDLRLGYRARNRELADQIRLDAAWGVKWNDKVELVPALRGTLALNPDTSGAFREDGEQDYSLVKAELKGIYHLDDSQWIEAGVSQPIAGVQTGDGVAFTLGFARRF